MSDEPRYYLLWLRVRSKEHYLLWEPGEGDRVAVIDGVVLHFESPELARRYTEEAGQTLSAEEPLLHDTDAAARWVQGEAEFDPNLMLAIWNAADDVLRGLGQPTLIMTHADRRLYQKLFRSADIPVLAPYRPKTPPVWRAGQLKRLRDSTSRGIQVLQQSVGREGVTT